jgi:1-deoxy-D-xylulose-5-phosphate synthase
MLVNMISAYKQGNILKKIDSPNDLKSLSNDELLSLAKQVREYILEVLSENPGHLASSLGAVELTIALHKVFNTPEDPIVWDVGHQAYIHKVLTGRRNEFVNIRKFGGLSGFPKRSESVYDSFGVGHSSTSISAALAMAIADKLQKKDNHHIAVIGDGSMTGGMAFEALNHAGTTDANLLIILNDNGISIDKRVGAMSQYLTMITASATYNRVKNRIWNLMGGNTDQIGTHGFGLERNLHKTLHSIGVEIGIRAKPVRQLCHLRYGHNRTNLVVNHHNGNKNGIFSQRSLQGIY